MTEADETAKPVPEPAPDFVIVPTLDGWKTLAGRVRQLEQRAAEPIAAPPLSIIQEPGAAERLDRHRRELEQLKSWCNAMTLYLAAILPAGIQQPPKPEDYL